MKEKNNKAVVITVVVFVIVAAVILGIMFLLPRFSDGGGITKNEMHPEITGMWQAEDDEGFVISIWQEDDGRIYAQMDKEIAEDAIAFWECSGTWKSSVNGFTYRDCKKETTNYLDDKDFTNEDYSEGKGKVYLENDMLVWEDEEEQTAEGIYFKHIGEY